MIKILLMILVASPALASDYYLRQDGGTQTECNGRYDAPKNESKNCAWSAAALNVAAETNKDNINFSKGTFTVSIHPPIPTPWITMTQFMANPKKYTDLVASGKKIYIQNYNGRNYELILK